MKRQVNCINRCEDPEKVLNDITNACVGLTTREIRRALGHSLAKNNKRKIDAIEFLNEDDEALPNTCYSYLRSYLEEAGLISKVSSLESKLLDEADLFYSQISL